MATDQHTPRPLTLPDLWLPGDVLGGAMLRGWNGPTRRGGWRRSPTGEMEEVPGMYPFNVDRGQDAYAYPEPHHPNNKRWLCGYDIATLRFYFTRPEVRDRAVRVIGADLLPIHAAEIRGNITPNEAAGLVWCYVLRKEAGIDSLRGAFGGWTAGTREGDKAFRKRESLYGYRRRLVVTDRLWFSDDMGGAEGRSSGSSGREEVDTMALSRGFALREIAGSYDTRPVALLLPLPNGIVGRLEVSHEQRST